MKSFRTELHLKASLFNFGLNNPIFTIGSCFADLIGEQLVQTKFKVSNNPLGVIYNPYSIHRALHYSLEFSLPAENTYVQHEGLWSNYEFHSSFSGLTKEEVILKISNSLRSAHNSLKETEVLLITYGSAWVYENIETGEVVANCHKVPAKNFKKILLNTEAIAESFRFLYQALKKQHSSLQIILSVSPVRHTKDILPLNQVSKSVLRLACHEIEAQCADVEYFPAYEIMMDDLRDYRFYQPDMIHPSDEAVNYIWHKFSERYFNDITKNFIDRWKSISTDLRHRPFHLQSDDHQNFLKQVLQKLEELKPTVNVDAEIATILLQLKS